MNHESNKSASLGMISTATRTTATVSPLSPLTNGSAVAQSANSGFAAALRKLAKQAEDPRGSAVSGESSPVSSPATSHSSPATTPKRASLGPFLGQNRGRGVPSTPPVVTIAPTKTSNGLWRTEGRQAELSIQGLSRERVAAESSQPQQDKRTPPIISPHPLAFGHTPSNIMQDPRIQSISLPGQMHSVVPSGAIPEEYLRALRPFANSEDLRLTSLSLSLDPAVAAHAASAAAYYHPAYLHHPLSLQRMDESLCLSALRSQFYSVPAGGAFPPLHPSALHLHLPGGRYTRELNHTALSERLQMENELRQREREQEREREKEREREAGLEREREEELEREREREVDRQKERQRDRHQQMVRAAESHYLAELQARRPPPEDRSRPSERLTPNRLDKTRDSDHQSFPGQKPRVLQPGLHSSRASAPHPIPNLLPSHLGKHRTAAPGGIPAALVSTTMNQRTSDEAWLTQQQQREAALEVSLRSPGKGVEPRRDRTHSLYHNTSNKDVPACLGAPPPLISPKGPYHPHVPPTTLWNPASLVDTPTDSRRKLNPSTPPIRPPPGLTRADRPLMSWGERMEDAGRRTANSPERYPSLRGGNLQDPWNKAEEACVGQNLYSRHHIKTLHPKLRVPPSDLGGRGQAASPPLQRERQRQAPDSVLVYDEVLQQHRRLLSKLDLEEKRRKEAREGGFYYDLDDSYDESDEEEVKAHLRRVTEQPPLKLDTSSEKVDFLHSCGLTTLAHRDELLSQKRRKRRRRMRERSVSPPAVQGKRTISSLSTPSTPLSTTYSAEQMDKTPELKEKKDFLHLLNLTHVNPQQRREKERTEELLMAIQRKTVTLDTLRYNPSPLCRSPCLHSAGDSSTAAVPSPSNGHMYPDSPSPSPPYLHKPMHLHNDTLKPSKDSQLACNSPPVAPYQEKPESMESSRKLQTHQNGVSGPLSKAESDSLQNGRNRPWERFTPESFAQRFHQTVLHSSHNTLKSKGWSQHSLGPNETALPSSGGPNSFLEAGGRSDRCFPHNISQKKAANLIAEHTPINGHHSPAASQDPPASLDHVSEGEEEDSDQEDDEAEEAPRKWQGIEAIFEAYKEYMEDASIERQILYSQCKKLEAQNCNLTRTAEQLSVTMGELVTQRQKVREERDRLQAQLEHFRRCLTLPNIHWGRGQVNVHLSR